MSKKDEEVEGKARGQMAPRRDPWRVSFVPRGKLAAYETFFLAAQWIQLASSLWKPEMQLNILKHTG